MSEKEIKQKAARKIDTLARRIAERVPESAKKYTSVKVLRKMRYAGLSY